MERTARTSLTVCCTTALAALAFGQQNQAPEKKNLVVIDEVVGTVNDAAILRTTLDKAVSGSIRGREQELGRPLTDQEAMQLRRQALTKLVDEHSMAQAARTLGVVPPARVEEIVQDGLKRATREQIRQLGSELRFTQELKDNGQSWPTWERDQRLRIMSELAEGIAVWGRLQQQRNLYITPRMMREFYYKNRLHFEHPATATVARIGFIVDTDRDKVLASAREAAELWRKEPLSSTDLAARCKGARPQADLIDLCPEIPPPGVPQDVIQFAASPAGTVSDPVMVGDSSIFVMKVVDRREGVHCSFEDPATQAEIRRALEQNVVNMVRREAVQRSRDRTYIWMPGM
jgi:hypothetical protein